MSTTRIRSKAPKHIQENSKLTSKYSETKMGVQSHKSYKGLANKTILECKYDRQLALLLIPCFVVAVFSGGRWLLGVGILGLTIVYIAESLNMIYADIAIGWVVILLSTIIISFNGFSSHRSVIFKLFLCFNFSTFFFLVGLWGMLHSPTFLKEFDFIFSSVEQITLSCLCMPSTIILMIGIVSLVGVEEAPFYLCFVLFAAYKITMTPIISSHQEPKLSKHREEFICGTFASAVHCMLYHFLPFLFHFAINYRSFFTALGFSNSVLLLVIPVLLLHVVTNSDEMFWWLNLCPEEFQQCKRNLVTTSLLAAVGAFEYRVVIHSFSPYLYYSSFSPFLSALLVTIAMYSALAAAWLAIEGFEETPFYDKSRVEEKILHFKCVVICSALSTSLAIGVPYYLLPLVVLAGYCNVVFWLNKTIIYYFSFLLVFSCVIGWFIKQNFWFLSVTFDSIFTLQQICAALFFLCLIALLLPVLITANYRELSGILLFFHSLGLAIIEYFLHSQNNEAEATVYGWYLVLLTSVVGTYMCYNLRLHKKLPNIFYWLILTIYIGKLGLLICDSVWDLFSFVLLTATISPLFMLYSKERSMSQTNALIHCITIMLTLFSLRNSILVHMITSFIGVSDMMGISISTSEFISSEMRFSVFLLLSFIAMLPISFKHLGHIPSYRRANILAILIACLFAFLQPGIDLFSDNVGELNPVDVVDEPKWPTWLLFIALSFLIMSLRVELPLSRLLFALILGTCFGLYVCGILLPTDWIVYGLCVIGFNAIAMYIIYLVWPTLSSAKILSTSYAIFIVVMPATYFIIGEEYGYVPQRKGQKVLTSIRITFLAIVAGLNFLVALAVKINRELDWSQTGAPKRPLRQLGNMSSLSSTPRAAQMYLKNKQRQDTTSTIALDNIAIYTGNLAAIISFILALVVNMDYLDGSELCIFFLAPILLLLNQNSRLTSMLTDDRKYFPVVFITCIFLASIALVDIFYGFSTLTQDPEILRNDSEGWMSAWNYWVLKNMLFVGFASPSLIKFVKFLWDVQRQDNFWFFVIGPLNIPCIVWGDSDALRLLGAIGLVGTIYQLYIAHKTKQLGLQLL